MLGQWCPLPPPRQVLAVTAFQRGHAGEEQGRRAGTGQRRRSGWTFRSGTARAVSASGLLPVRRRVGGGGALTPAVRGGAGRGSPYRPHLLRGPAPQTDPGSCIATGCSAPQCPANSGGADGALWWDCLGRPPPVPSAFFSLPRLSPSLRPLESKFTERFPLTHWAQTKEAPPSPGPVKGLTCLFPKGGAPGQCLNFPCPPPTPDHCPWGGG